jgi:hypothetical protein
VRMTAGNVNSPGGVRMMIIAIGDKRNFRYDERHVVSGVGVSNIGNFIKVDVGLEYARLGERSK